MISLHTHKVSPEPDVRLLKTSDPVVYVNVQNNLNQNNADNDDVFVQSARIDRLPAHVAVFGFCSVACNSALLG